MDNESNTDDQLKTVYHGYLSLQAESYEFISRTIAMHRSLAEIFRIFRDHPRASSEQLYALWGPVLGEIYEHLFAAFFRPYRTMIFPFGEFVNISAGTSATSAVTSTMSVLELWAEAQARFAKGFTEATQSQDEQTRLPTRGGNGHGSEEITTVSPFNLLKQIGDADMKICFEAAEQFFGLLGHSQFLIPRSLIVNLQKLFSDYREICYLSGNYELLFRRTWQKAVRRFASEMREQGDATTKFKEFLASFLKTLSQEFDHLLRSDEYCRVQNRLIDLGAEMTSSMRKVMEIRAETYPYLPFITTSEMKAVEKHVHEQKRRLDYLERRVAEMEDNLAAARASEE